MNETYLLNMPYEEPHLKTPERYMGEKQNGEVPVVYIGLDGGYDITPEALAEENRKYENEFLKFKYYVTDPNGVIRIEEVPIHSKRVKELTGGLEEAAENASEVIRST